MKHVIFATLFLLACSSPAAPVALNCESYGVVEACAWGGVPNDYYARCPCFDSIWRDEYKAAINDCVDTSSACDEVADCSFIISERRAIDDGHETACNFDYEKCSRTNYYCPDLGRWWADYTEEYVQSSIDCFYDSPCDEVEQCRRDLGGRVCS